MKYYVLISLLPLFLAGIASTSTLAQTLKGNELYIENSNSGNSHIPFPPDNSVYLSGQKFIYRNPAHEWKFFINGTTGNVGIGTSNPTHKLQVMGGTFRALYNSGQMTSSQMDDINGDLGTGGIVENPGGDLHLRSYWGVVIDKNGGNYGESPHYTGVNPAGGTFAVRTRISPTSFRTDFVVHNDGSIGINTLKRDANFKLSVNGKIRASEVKVYTTWADYVFYPTYKLRPLSEVESFIKLNQHLPEVPSAAEVEKDGVNVGEMEATLLKKIEELTLYLIEQNKQLTEQTKQLAEQNQKMMEQNQKLEVLQQENCQHAEQLQHLYGKQNRKKSAKDSAIN